MKILIVDDEAMSRRLLAMNLRHGGHEIVEGDNGQTGWEVFQQTRVRLVITDWMMPEVDGRELVRRIRATDAESYTYIIMLTALGTTPNIVTGLEAGADDYMTKPFDAEELLARIKIGERIVNLEESLRASTKQMEYLAMHDGLTNLLNRRALHDRAQAELHRAQRDQSPLSVLLLDIDHFKAINDTHGHAVGDEALQQVARVLTQQVRAYDVVCRWGGEEFLALLPKTGLSEAHLVAERIRAALEAQTLKLKDNSLLRLTASLGLTTLTGALSFHELTHHADVALYAAKHNGRNQVCVQLPAPPSPIE